MKDRFLEQIIEALGGDLNPREFQLCVCDLLREEHPGLAPVSGVQDGGMDGAIPTVSGDTAPLIVTTSAPDGAVKNLRKNLDSYLQSGGKQRAAVFAASCLLSRKWRDALDKAAEDRGFRLAQIHDRASLALRLYHSPHWCRSLLGLVGDPPALAGLSPSSRPFFDVPMVGREALLSWLESMEGDCLLLGQPGSGKTFLHSTFARKHSGLFVVSDDIGRVADGIRAERPGVLILDDAHEHLGLLGKLLHLRREVKGEFRIYANCWPGEEAGVRQLLQLTNDQVSCLGLLSADELVKVVHGCGLLGPEDLVQEIVNQAGGRPGLAVSLCQVLLKGGTVGEIHDGGLLLREVQRALSQNAVQVMALLAIGGDCGLSLTLARDFLAVPELEFRECVAELESRGFIIEVSQGVMAVYPRPLRYLVVRSCFFGSGYRMDANRVIESVEAYVGSKYTLGRLATSMAETLIHTRGRGGDVPDHLLLRLIKHGPTERRPSLYRMYAWLGAQECSYILDAQPEFAVEIAEPALFYLPEQIIPELFERAIADKRPEHQFPNHPMRKLEDWCLAAQRGTGEVFERRKVLMDAARDWLGQGGHEGVGMRAVSLAISPKFESHRVAPGSGRTITFAHGSVALEDLEKLKSLWAPALEMVTSHASADMKKLLISVEQWNVPGSLGLSVPRDVAVSASEFGRRMLLDMAHVERLSNGVRRSLKELAGRCGIELAIKVEEEFELLFPIEGDLDWKDLGDVLKENAERLASTLRPLGEDRFAERFKVHIHEAARLDLTWPTAADLLCSILASRVENPADWARALAERQVPQRHVFPFLSRALADDAARAEELLAWCLENADYRRVATHLVLSSDTCSAGSFERAIRCIEASPSDVRQGALLQQYSLRTMKRLLGSEKTEVRGAAAAGEWQSDPKGEVRGELESLWAAGLVSGEMDDYVLESVFASRPDMADRWLASAVERRASALQFGGKALRSAVTALGREQRLHWAETMSEDAARTALPEVLVANDVEVYGAFLGNGAAKAAHLEPLQGSPTVLWARKAVLASRAGYTDKEIVAATQLGGRGWSGPLSGMWRALADAFRELLPYEDPLVRRIARHGVEFAQDHGKRERAREEIEDVYGR